MIENLFWYFNAGLAAAAAAKIIGSLLLRQYPALTTYLCFLPLRSAFLMYFESDPNLYGWGYILSTPVLSILRALVGLELYKSVFEAYSGIAVIGRRSLLTAVAAGTVISWFYTSAGVRVAGEPFPVLRYVLLFESWISFVILFFLITLTTFVVWFPVPLKRNLVTYSFGFCIALAATCAGVAMRVFAGAETRHIASTVILALSAAVYGAWTALLSARGEAVLPRGAVPRPKEEQERLLQQLKSLNEMAHSVKSS